MVKITPHVHPANHWDAVWDVSPGVQVVQVSIFHRSTHTDAGMEFGQLVQHFVHIDVDKVVEHETKTAFIIVFAQQHHLPPKIGVIQEGFAQENVPWLRLGLVCWRETNHRDLKVPSFVVMKTRTLGHPLFTPGWGQVVLLILMVLGLGCQTADDGSDENWPAELLQDSNSTPTWEEAVAMAQRLADQDHRVSLHRLGKSDIGRPIHALVLLAEEDRSRDEEGAHAVQKRLKAQGGGKVTVLVNNAIHPGEPCGVNASFALIQDWLALPDGPQNPLSAANWVFIPQYNVGGASRRNCCTRANQNGPESYGFRGNAANLDLNRDFVKMDSRNAEVFVDLFHAVNPDVFVDTHTSNGADYPYTMTLITTQPDKAGPIMGPFLREVVEPALYQGMAQEGWPMVPYVYSKGETPEAGVVGFLETPRYSTGFTTLWGTLGFTTEAHMLKPFADRVKATKSFLQVLSDWLLTSGPEVLSMRKEEARRVADASELEVRWTLAQDQRDSVAFTGYASQRMWSAVTQGTRLRYDTSQTWTKHIPFDNRYVPSATERVPTFWVLPQAWRRAVARLQANGVRMTPLPRDTVMLLEVSRIESFQSANRPYEGHHPLTIDSVSRSVQPVQLYQGDWQIPSGQNARRYLAEVLSPKAHDALLVWNFFDSALQQKEHFSGYVFEDTAEDLLQGDEALRMRYAAAQTVHPEWKDNPRLALRWLYEASPHYEATDNRYPVYASP